MKAKPAHKIKWEIRELVRAPTDSLYDSADRTANNDRVPHMITDYVGLGKSYLFEL